MSDLIERMKSILEISDRGIFSRNRNCETPIMLIFDEAMTEIEQLRAQVKELEGERDAAEAELWGANYFTNEMIDTAWEYIHDQESYEAYHDHEDCSLLWEAGGVATLAKLGIEQCKGCGGSGTMWFPWDDSVIYKCPACAPWGSKGWVIGG